MTDDRRIITLIGYRGCGKSTVAAPLAERLGCGWIDADVEIERRAGCSIKEMFEREGEAGFRRRERETLAELLQRGPLVLAAGGGAILNADTRRDFRAAGPVVWLQAAAATLYERITTDVTTGARRPNLTSLGGLPEIENLLRQRRPLYEAAATLSIDTEGLTVAEIVQAILNGISDEDTQA